MKLSYVFWSVLCLSLLFYSCQSRKGTVNGEAAIDLPEIMERGELVVLTANSSTSYFNYRGEPMGFQYELAQQFARSLGLKLKLKVVNNPSEMVRCLIRGEGKCMEGQSDLLW